MSENNHPFSHERGQNPLMDEGMGERLRQISPSYADIAAYVQSVDPQIIADGEAAAAAQRQAQQEAITDVNSEVVDPTPVANVALSASMEDAGMLADDTAEQDPTYPDSIAPDNSDLRQDDVELAA